MSWRSERRRAVDDRQRDRVQRAHLQPGKVDRALAHLLLRPLVERDQADRRGRQVPLREQVAGPFGEHAGLARTGRSDDPRRTAGVGDRGELVGREVGDRRVAGGNLAGAVFERNDVHHRHAVDRRRRSGQVRRRARPTVPSARTTSPSARSPDPVSGGDLASPPRRAPCRGRATSIDRGHEHRPCSTTRGDATRRDRRRIGVRARTAPCRWRTADRRRSRRRARSPPGSRSAARRAAAERLAGRAQACRRRSARPVRSSTARGRSGPARPARPGRAGRDPAAPRRRPADDRGRRPARARTWPTRGVVGRRAAARGPRRSRAGASKSNDPASPAPAGSGIESVTSSRPPSFQHCRTWAGASCSPPQYAHAIAMARP